MNLENSWLFSSGAPGEEEGKLHPAVSIDINPASQRASVHTQEMLLYGPKN